MTNILECDGGGVGIRLETLYKSLEVFQFLPKLVVFVISSSF